MTDPTPHYEHDTATDQQSRQRTDEPPLFRVILLNDDFTPMEFVVDLLMRFFGKNEADATRIMLDVHHQGRGVCGLFPRQIAETRITEVHRHARNSGHPLKCEMERA